MRKTLVDTIAALRFLDFSSEEYGTIEMVLAEIMNNIVEHAYANDPDGMIELEILPANNGLKCILRDDGQPMPDGNVPMGCLPSQNVGPDFAVDDLPEGGFGWFLIRDLTRDLQYTRADGKNVLTFRIATGPQGLRSN
ncbi:ATP-binding protein [Profundibacter sp.]